MNHLHLGAQITLLVTAAVTDAQIAAGGFQRGENVFGVISTSVIGISTSTVPSSIARLIGAACSPSGVETNIAVTSGRSMISKLLADAQDADQVLLGHLMLAAGKVARQLGVGDAFRLVVNNGADAGQTVFHLHLHILAGRPLHWPPG